MKMTERFTRAYNALVKAYHEGTLAKGTCVACACGNIIADAMGAKVFGIGGTFFCEENNQKWSDIFLTTPDGQTTYFGRFPETEKAIKHLTGYSVEEFAKIEYTFEMNTKISFISYFSKTEQEILEDQYNGLSAVVDVMLELDGVTKTDNSFNEKFREHPKLQKA